MRPPLRESGRSTPPAPRPSPRPPSRGPVTARPRGGRLLAEAAVREGTSRRKSPMARGRSPAGCRIVLGPDPRTGMTEGRIGASMPELAMTGGIAARRLPLHRHPAPEPGSSHRASARWETLCRGRCKGGNILKEESSGSRTLARWMPDQVRHDGGDMVARRPSEGSEEARCPLLFRRRGPRAGMTGRGEGAVRLARQA